MQDSSASTLRGMQPWRLARELRHDLRVWLAVKRVARQWRAQSRSPDQPENTAPVRRAILLPTDPFTLIGSKGDEAMMQAVAQTLAAREPDVRVAVVTATAQAAAAARAMGFEPLPVWREPWLLHDFVNDLAAFRPDALVVIGADVLDGYYSPNTAMRLLASADMMARRGVRTVITGFSFNDTPSPHLKPLFDGACSRLRINVRERVSLERFRRFSRAPAALVADVAFALKPDTRSGRVGAIAQWVARRRAAGDTVLAFNMHPMLVRDGDPERMRSLAHAAADALRQLAPHRGISVLLLTHDYRDGVGDESCLAALHDLLRADLGERVARPQERLSAAELKAAAGLMDGVLTGRMHLAIASLGMGVPVAALTYQDKFQGLFEHFGLPASLLLAPGQAALPGRLATLLDEFVSELPRLRALVTQALPAVMAATERNFSGLVQSVPDTRVRA